MYVPFDNNTGEKYSLELYPEDADTGDGVVLSMNKGACESFAKLFSELARAEEGTHVHIGYDESEPQGPGFRLTLTKK